MTKMILDSEKIVPVGVADEEISQERVVTCGICFGTTFSDVQIVISFPVGYGFKVKFGSTVNSR